jgi:MFS family permease
MSGPSPSRPAGLLAFTLVWAGQVVSLLGSAMSAFALTIWAWTLTGSVTALALVATFQFAPTILFSPVAGALVDRWNRKLVMMLSDLGTAATVLVLLGLLSLGRLEIWHLCAAGLVSGLFQAFQWPAYSAAIALMLPKAHYGRANGMISMAESGAEIVAPALAGVLLLPLGLRGILLIDLATFVVALLALLAVHVPQPAPTAEGEAGRGSLWHETAYGFRYIGQRPSLLGLQLVFFSGNLLTGLGYAVLAPMILVRTGGSAALLGSVQSLGAIGGVAGGLLMTAWGGPRRRVHGVLLGHFAHGLCYALHGLGLPFWHAASFSSGFTVPVIDGSNQALWQAKVAPDVQGRVFAVRMLIAQVSYPLATLLAGPLADRVFEPAMRPGAPLAAAFSWLVGAGPGSGMALLLVLTGLAASLVGLVPYALPVIRDAERRLPDHAGLVQPAASPASAGAQPAPGLTLPGEI